LSIFFVAPQLENIPWWGKNIFGGRQQTSVLGEKYTKNNKINNNSENFREASPPLLSCGPDFLYYFT